MTASWEEEMFGRRNVSLPVTNQARAYLSSEDSAVHEHPVAQLILQQRRLEGVRDAAMLIAYLEHAVVLPGRDEAGKGKQRSGADVVADRERLAALRHRKAKRSLRAARQIGLAREDPAAVNRASRSAFGPGRGWRCSERRE